MDTTKLFSGEAEGATIGSILHDSESLTAVIQILPDSKMFYLPENRRIYEAMLLLMGENVPIDGISIQAKLKLQGEPDGEPVNYLGEVYGTIASSANVEYYANQVRDRFRYRELIVMQESVVEILADNLTPDEMTDKVRELCLDLDEGDTTTWEKIDAVDAACALTENDTDHIETGFADLDKKVRFRKGEVVVVAARPGMGKTAITTNIVQNMAKAGHGVLFCSLEMPPRQITQRMIRRASRVSARAPYLTHEQCEQINDAACEVHKLPIVYTRKINTPLQLRAQAANLVAARGVSIVVLDYIQIIGVDSPTQNRNNELAAVSRVMKMIALDLDVLVFVVSQLNRASAARKNKRPLLSELRESGAIEQDADWVLLLYRDDYYRDKDDKPDGVAEINIAKARDGATGTVEMVFMPEITNFENEYHGII